MSRLKALGLSVSLGLVFLAGVLRADDKPTPTPPTGADGAELPDFIKSRLSAISGSAGSLGENDPKRYKDFAELTKGATKIDGFLTLHRKDEHLYAEIKPFQFDQPMYSTAMIARGLAQAGMPIDGSVIVFHRAGDRVQVIARNINYKATAGTPLDKAVKQNYTDSVLMALPIAALNPMGGMSVVIDLADIYFTDFAQIGLGFLDRSRTNWFKVKAFPNNLELEVQATFGGGRSVGGRGGDDGVIDTRGITLVVHYSLLKLPDPMYRTRVADDRIGYFLDAVKDFGAADPDSNFIRYINRWRLEKADPRAKSSPPKKQIVWWVEDTVPHEYRPYVEAGILEWNKAFEKIGFRNAVAVRWQSDRDDFDPEDVNYCTFRWITTNRTFARSCFRTNPLTGEILDGDVIFDAGWIRAWKRDYALYTGSGAPPAQDGEAAPTLLAEVISPILANKMGYGQLNPEPRTGAAGELKAFPADWGPLQIRLHRNLANGRSSQAACLYSTGMQPELNLAAISFADAEFVAQQGPGGPGGPRPFPVPGGPIPAEAKGTAKLPEEFLGQMIKEVVMHEVGHSLGLRHNFKASTILKAEQLNDTAVTVAKGQAGSVMDYNPINLAPKGQKQGDYVTSTLGPYDYWAIEYGYKEFAGPESEELKKVASRAAEPDLVFATDEDMMMNEDPYVNTYDLGADPCAFAKERLALVEQLAKELDSKVVRDGESWVRVRTAFNTLLNQYGNAAHLATAFVGGQSVSRDHKGDKDARDPIVPIPGSKQRDALALLTEKILSDKSFKFSPALLRKMTAERWYHWGTQSGEVGISLNDRVLRIQQIVLSHCLSGDVLSRLQNQELQVEASTNPLKVSEVFRTLTDGIWSELKVDDKATSLAVSTIRRNLQREHLSRLSRLVLGSSRGGSIELPVFLVGIGSIGGSSTPADARALARMHLNEIRGKIGAVLARKVLTIDDTTRAHLEESHQRLTKILDAGVQSNEP